MELFEMTVRPADWNRYRVEGKHRAYLPAVVCGSCGSRWKAVGESYPTVNLSSEFEARVHTESVLSVERFLSLRDDLRTQAPQATVLNPGTAIGPFAGVLKGRHSDVVWHESWTVFLQLDTWIALESAGVRLPTAGKALIGSQNEDPPLDMLEPEAIPSVALSRKGLRNPDAVPCSKCGRLPSGFEEFLIELDSLPAIETDLMRATNNTAIYIVTDRFVQAMQKLGIKGCVFNPLRAAQ